MFKSLLSVFWGYMLRSRVAGSYGNSVFNFLKNPCTIFHRSCTISLSRQQCTRVPVCRHLCQEFFFKILSICFYFWLCWVFVAASRLSPAVVSGEYSLVAMCRLIAVASLVAEQELYSTWAWCTGFVALWHVKSSQTRGWTCVSCSSRWILTLDHQGCPLCVFVYF